MNKRLPPDWLFDPVDIDEIESDWLDKPGPYGVSSEEWTKLRSQSIEGDFIHAFSSPPGFWQNLAGRTGYALVRDGNVIAYTVTMMN
jgi:hypothetical protein